MICPTCKTPNPEEATACLKCSGGLGVRLDDSADLSDQAESMQTIVPPSNFQDWAKGQALYATPVSLVLPEGVEIGHRYKVVKLLGVGGMGSVYRVHDRELDRDVALKLIRSEIASNPETLERFKREIQLSSRVTHGNVLRVFDLGETHGVKYLTMEYVAGEDLAALIKREKKLPIPKILSIFRQICEGLQAAHQKGVIHRDLKPQNVMLDAQDHVLLTDFGLAKTLEQTGVTHTGAVIGTPNYMSPEQVRGETAGPQSDIYSLGVILYEMAAGKVPFTGKSVFEVMVQRMHKPPRPVTESNPEVPAYLERILERCLAIDPTHRYQSVGEILADLDNASFRPTLRYAIHRRRWLKPAAVGLAVALLLGAGGVWLYRRGRSAKPATQKARSVLVADFANRTGEPVFDGTLESAFTLALEGASFVSSYNRNSAKKIAAQLQPGMAGLDETVARLVAVREGVNIVTSGSVDKRGDGYSVSVRAVDAATGKAIANDEEKAPGKEAVLTSVARLAAKVRRALGDATPESTQLAAAETYTAGSIEAAHEYAVAQNLQWDGKWDEAIRGYRKALDLDGNLGRAYAGLAAVESNRGRRQEAESYYKQALSRIDRMSEREKYRTRGGYYLLVRNPDNAIEEFSALVKQYPADTAGIANLAFAYFLRRDMPRALEEARRAVDAYPKNVPQRNNLGLYAMYAGDFQTAIREQDEVLRLNPRFILAYVGKALSQLALGHADQAAETYRRAAAIDVRGASLAAMGLADIALTQGRPDEAAPILERGIEADTANQDADAAAAKLVALAQARLGLKDSAAAVAAAEKAIAMARGENVLYPAAQVYLATGREAKALSLATELGARLEPDPQAYAELIRGESELARNRPADALRRFQAAKKIADSWAGRLDLGRSYLAARAFPEADAELENCLRRRGEATALFLDESPSFRVFPPVFYSLGLAREGLKSPGATDAFKSFLAFRPTDGDPLAADAKQRLAGK
jgi:tetratricopeptide (TPR) repeat protein/predicted Ser/Thr protein kinase